MVHCLAPEQARDSRRVDIRSDIYSLGCTLYYLLTGRVPFPGIGLAEIVVQHQLDEPEPIEKLRPDVCAGVTAVLRKMMAKRAEDRYQTPAEVATALTPFCRPALDPTATAAEAVISATGTPSPAWSPKMDPIPSSATEIVEVRVRQSLAERRQRRKWRTRLFRLACAAFILAICSFWFEFG